MDKIIINKKDGGKYQLLSYENSYGITSAEQVKELMGQDVVNIVVKSAVPIAFNVGDWLEVFGERYQLNALPAMDKISDREFDYTLVFESAMYDLVKVQYLNVDATGYSTGSDFSLMGNLTDFVNLIIANLRRVYGAVSWERGGTAADTVTKLMTFQNENCLLTLQNLCTEYDQEFYIERTGENKYKLHVRKNEAAMEDVFSYGRGKGLYELNRKNIDNRNIITRLYAYGSTRNIMPGYRGGSTRLKLPQDSIFSEASPFIQIGTAVEKYGVIEQSVIFEDIFPERTGAVTSVFTNEKMFRDASMPFDLNERVDGTTTYRIQGMEPKVIFISGGLAGYEFDVTDYDSNSQTFTLKPYEDERGLTIPSEKNLAFRIQPGDQYKLLNINLPASYIKDAEIRLREEAYKYLNENCYPRVQYGLTVDRFFTEKRMKELGTDNYFRVGDYVPVRDADLGLMEAIQLKSFTRDLIDPYKYEVELGERRKTRMMWMEMALRHMRGVLAVNNITGQAVNAVPGNINQTIISGNTPAAASGGLKWASFGW